MLKSSPPLRRFFAAYLQSELGTGAAYVALVLIAYQRLHSGWAIALVLLADFLPGIVFAAPFGTLADRVSRRKLVVGADLLRAGAFIGLALIPSFGATVLLALLAGVGSAMFRPAINAALTGLVTPEERSPATALRGAIYSAGFTVGPALTAVVLLFSAPTLVLAVNGLTFLISAAVLSGVPLDRAAGSEDGEATSGAPERQSLWSATVDGVRSSTRIPGMTMLLVIGTLWVLAGAVMNVAEPLLATGSLRAGSTGYSLLVATYGAGVAVGSLANGRAGSLVPSLRRRLLLGMALSGVGMIASATAPSLGWAFASFALTGFSNGLTMGPELRLVQELVTDGLLGRIFGLRDALNNAAFVLAFLTAGAVLAVLGVRGVFAVGGAMLLLLAAVSSVRFRPVQPGARVQPVSSVA